MFPLDLGILASSIASGDDLVPIAWSTPSAAASVTFSSIPGTYRDLYAVAQLTNTTGNSATWRFNGDSTALYSYTGLWGSGTLAGSSRGINQTYVAYPGGTMSTSVPTAWILHVPNYASTTQNKTALIRGASDINASGVSEIGVGLYRSTAAITSVTFFPVSGTVTGYVALYGVA